MAETPEERLARLRANFAKGRETRAANREARLAARAAQSARAAAHPISSSPLAGHEYDAPDSYAPTDEELGVGIATPEDQLAQALADPRIGDLINKAVEARLQGLVGAAAPTAGVDQSTLVQALITALDRHSSAQAYQQPGHVKPLSSEEVERRAAAYVEMGALIRQAEQAGERPIYLLTAEFYCDEVLWPEGQTIYWHGPPSIMMEPRNEIASRIMAEMWTWIGEQIPVADQVADAWANRPRGESIHPPEPASFREPRQSWQSRVEAVPGVARQQIGPNRIVGTVQPELPAGSISGPRRLPDSNAPRIGTVMPYEAPGPHQNF